MRINLGKPWVQASILTGALAGLAIPLVLLAYYLHAWPGVLAAALACVICLTAAVLALALAHLFPTPELVAVRVVLTMLPRTGIPLGACVLLYLRGGMLVEAGIVYYIMAFYFVALLIETVLFTHIKPTEQPTASRTG